MEAILILIITFIFLSFGPKLMKKIDLFIDNNLEDDTPIVYIDNTLLLNCLSNLSYVQFDLDAKDEKKVCLQLQTGELTIAVFSHPILNISSFENIEMEEVQLKVAHFPIYNTIYILHVKNKGLDLIKWIKQ